MQTRIIDWLLYGQAINKHHNHPFTAGYGQTTDYVLQPDTSRTSLLEKEPRAKKTGPSLEKQWYLEDPKFTDRT